MEQLDKATKQQPGFSDNQDGWQVVRNGINFFRQYFAKEYMVLLRLMSIIWNFGPTAERARFNLKLKKNKKKQELASSSKPQAPESLGNKHN